MRERELFRYRAGDDAVRSLDPRLKLPLFLLLAFCTGALPGMFLLLILPLPAAAALLAGVSPLTLFRESRSLLIIALLLFLSVSFLSEQPGAASAVEGAVRSARFLMIVLIAHILVETTSTEGMGSAVHHYLRPFSPALAEKSALSISLTIRFIPLLFDVLDDIDDAGKSRSIESCRNPFRRILSIVLPLFSVLLERSAEMIEALESRGIGRDGRMKPPGPGAIPRSSLLLFLGVFLYLCGLIVLSLRFRF
jgi:biotin transport system permease protein